MPEHKEPLALMQDVIFLKSNALFKDVRTEELKAIAAIARESPVNRDTKIVTEGEPGGSLFLVKEGSIRITKLIHNREATLATLHQGDCFGEMVIFEDMPRSASAYSMDTCILMVIEKEDLLDVIKQFPDIAIQLFRMLGGRLRAANEKVKELSAKLGESQ